MSAPVSVYKIKRTFRAPIAFAYHWCTDYTEADRELQGESGYRQIIRKSPRRVVYEDLTPTPRGWMWSRETVTLLPPDRWHAVAVGNYRIGGTLTIRFARSPTGERSSPCAENGARPLWA